MSSYWLTHPTAKFLGSQKELMLGEVADRQTLPSMALDSEQVPTYLLI